MFFIIIPSYLKKYSNNLALDFHKIGGTNKRQIKTMVKITVVEPDF